MATEAARNGSEKYDDPRIGSILENRYRILERLAHGGMGVVYRAERVKLKRIVAIKYLHAGFANNKEAMQRFEREARVASQLNHPSCVPVSDFGTDGVPYIVMPFITGQNLKQVLRQGRLQPARALHIIHQVLAALSHAHSLGMVHRDIKPANIMLTNVEGTVDHVYVLDFGLAKMDGGSLGNDITATHMLVGTPSYMSPEQGRGDKNIDEASDIYSTGAVLFELLIGQKLYQHENPLEVLQMHQKARIPSLRERVPKGEFSSELEALVERALAKKRTARFASATEFAKALVAVPEAEFMPRSVSAENKIPAGDDILDDHDEDLPSVRMRDRSAVRARQTSSDSPGEDAAATSHPSADSVARPRSGRMTGSRSAQDPVKLSLDDTIDAESLESSSQNQAPGDSPSGVRKAQEATSLVNTMLVAKPGARARAIRDRLGVVAFLVLLIPIAAAGVTWYLFHDDDSQAAQTRAVAADDSRRAEAKRPDQSGKKDSNRNKQQAEEAASKKARATAAKNTTNKSTRKSNSTAAFNHVETLIAKKKRDEAIRAIRKMLRTTHKGNYYLNYQLGNLYFEKRQWSNGLRAYTSALKKNRNYRNKSRLIKNTILSLSSDKTQRAANNLFLNYIKKSGLSYLRSAARSDKNAKVRRRASWLAKKLSR